MVGMITGILTHVVSSLVTIWVIFLLFQNGYFGNLPIYTFDVQKVMASYNQLIGRAAGNDLDSSLRLANASEKITEAVQSVSGGGLVILSGAVVSGASIDITDQVLQKLQVPVTTSPVQYLSGGAFPEMPSVADELADPSKLKEVVLDKMEKDIKQIEEAEQKKKIEGIIP